MHRNSTESPVDGQRSNRRECLKSSLAAVAAVAILPEFGIATETGDGRVVDQPAERIPLGFDNFSIRAWNWKADKLIAFAKEQKLDALLLSDLDVYESHEETYLKALAKQAADAGIVLHAGTGGICPSAKRFIKKWGSAEEHLKLGIRVAKALGSKVFRCYLGGAADRSTQGGIEYHIDQTVKVLKSVKSFAVDAGVKIAVENHAGDMQARELVTLIEAAGSDFVGATIDSGNATWTLESPTTNLELLAPYAASTGMRDSTVWMTDQGTAVAWNAIGEGQVDWDAYTKRFTQLCPDVPFQLEIISGFSKSFAIKQDDFWKAYQDVKATDYESYLRLARRGKPVPKGDSNNKDYQMAELKRSIEFCKNNLAMGRKV